MNARSARASAPCRFQPALVMSWCGMARRLDRYDIIGLTIVAVLAALWILHFLLPAPPPPPP
jgi:hypothetical protein